MSQSSDSYSHGGHPIDDVLDNRANGGSNTQQISSPESGELAQTLASNKRKAAAIAAPKHQSDTSDNEEDVIIKYRKAKKQKPIEEPLGVTVLEEGEENGRTSEMIRLLRQPRYFDTDDFEEFGSRCYNCGQVGHLARDCTSPILRQRSCFLCAQVGHDSRDCPNSLCWKCQEPGHLARSCPHKHTQLVREIVCLRCGRSDCPCAGHSDAYRAEGNCTFSYSSRDLQQIRCYVCGKLGHLNCAPYVARLPVKPTCYNCGEGGHYGEECTREAPPVMRAERNSMMREHRESSNHHHHNNNNNNNRERSTMGGGGGGGFKGGGYNNNNNHRGNFTWSRNYTTGGYNGNNSNEMKAAQQRIRNEQRRGSIGIDNRDGEGSKKKRKISNSTDAHSSGGGRQTKKRQQSTASQGGPSPDDDDDDDDGSGQKRKKRKMTAPPPPPRSKGGDSKRGGNQGNGNRKLRSRQNTWTRQ